MQSFFGHLRVSEFFNSRAILQQLSTLAYDEHDETPPRTSHGSPVWTAQASRCGAGISSGGNRSATKGHSGCNSLDWSAHVFVGTDCGWRFVPPSCSHSPVVDCQSSQHTLEDGAGSMSEMAIFQQLTGG